ncbi:MAG: HD domain-containing phosphohydrolase [Vulcanimicrobiaceae bacterium]
MNVFVIDDATINLKTYEKLLANLEGIKVYPFVKAPEALLALSDLEPDLVIVDYRMPEMDGLEFITRFRNMSTLKEVPVVMLTAERDIDIRRRAIESGANDFLNKPADPIEFVARVRNLLALNDSRRKLANRALQLADEVRKATVQIARREQETIHRLTRASEFRDNETGLHIVRMGRYSAILGRALGMNHSDQELLLLAAPMHDIGKVATPDNILLKPGKLTAEEWEIMKQHTTAGFEILRDSDSKLLQKGAEIALTHHEKWDGSGYPRGLAGDKIPIAGRICALADVFDALTSVRPYKPAWPIEQAIVHVHQGKGSHFDPTVVNAFERALSEIREIRETLADREGVPA